MFYAVLQAVIRATEAFKELPPALQKPILRKKITVWIYPKMNSQLKGIGCLNSRYLASDKKKFFSLDSVDVF